MYTPVAGKCVAKFYYKGSHSHPVKRTVVIIEETEHLICGYELREGTTTRKVSEAPIKSYVKNRITKYCELRKYNTKFSNSKKATIRREEIFDILKNGA